MTLIPVVAVENTLVTVLTVLSVGVDAVVGDTVENVVGVLVISVIDREAHSFVLQCGSVTTELKVTEILDTTFKETINHCSRCELGNIKITVIRNCDDNSVK